MKPEQKQENYRLAEQLLSEQNLPGAVISGILTTLAAATAWGVIRETFGHNWSVMAIGVGGAVGYTIQFFGKGIHTGFAVLAAVLTVVGCALGYLLAAILLESNHYQMPVAELLSGVPAKAIAEFVVVDFGLIDLMFWIMGISIASYYSKRRLNPQEQLALFTYRVRPPAKPETD